MLVFHKLEEVPAGFGRSVVSVGNFDGVHRAHSRVLCELIRQAAARNAKSVAVTFEPHPVRILRPDAPLRLITPTAEKLLLLEKSGIDSVLVLPFTRDMSLLSAHNFAQQILRDCLGTIEVHEGYNFRFGHKAAGDVKLLTDLGRELNFEVIVYPEMMVRRQSVSSSRIRDMIRSGQVSRARPLLGRPFSIVSTPGRGRGYGSKYTVPTINLSRYDELVPGNGVYVTRTKVGDETFDSVTNVGIRPTFGDDSFAVESHLLNFHPIDVIASTRVEISFLQRLRAEIKWPNVEALRAQIAKDVHRARRYFHLLSLR